MDEADIALIWPSLVMNPYDVLGVEPGAPLDEIRAAYRRMAFVLHPDRLATAPAGVQDEAARRMQQSTTAYASVLAELDRDADMEVVYSTDGWTNNQRAALTKRLLDSDVPHEWDGIELRTSRQWESVVDRIMPK
jgi:DnaJ-class molecular chaperone